MQVGNAFYIRRHWYKGILFHKMFEIKAACPLSGNGMGNFLFKRLTEVWL